MKKFLIPLTAISIAVSSVSCKKSNDKSGIDSIQKDLGPIAEVSLIEIKPSTTLPKGLPVYNLLGYGYDVTGKFNDASSSRASVINMESLSNDKLVAIGTANGTMFWSDTYDAEDAEKLAMLLSNELDQTKGKKLFTATIESFFPQELAFSEKYVYGFYSEQSRYKRLRVRSVYTDNFKNHLSIEFQLDIQTMSAELLVKKYGTHVLTSIILGGKLNAIYQGETSHPERLSALRAGHDAALRSTFGSLMAGLLNPIDSAKLRTIKTPKIAFEVFGGDPSQIKIIQTRKGKFVDKNAWYKSLTLETSVFIGTDELIPIAILIDNPIKKKEIDDYVSAYLKNNEVQIKK